jgi:hypothetical protein
MCLGALFVGSELGPPEHEKHCIDVSCPGRTRTFSSHRIQKHKFSVTCPIYISVRFVGYAVNYGFVQSLNLGGSTGGTDEAYRSPHEDGLDNVVNRLCKKPVVSMLRCFIVLR